MCLNIVMVFMSSGQLREIDSQISTVTLDRKNNEITIQIIMNLPKLRRRLRLKTIYRTYI